MMGWRAKIILVLMIFFAGFATAIYCLAPASQSQNSSYNDNEKSLPASMPKSNQFAQSFNIGMHKCLLFLKDATSQAGVFIKEKFDDRPPPSS